MERTVTPFCFERKLGVVGYDDSTYPCISLPINQPGQVSLSIPWLSQIKVSHLMSGLIRALQRINLFISYISLGMAGLVLGVVHTGLSRC